MKEVGYRRYLVQLVQYNTARICRSVHTRTVIAPDTLGAFRVAQSDAIALGLVGAVQVRVCRIINKRKYGSTVEENIYLPSNNN